MYKFIYKTAFLLITLLILGCSHDDKSPKTNIITDIVGHVNLYDASTNEVDHSGMTISISKSDPLISTTTDASGKFTLEKVPEGTYDLIYEKSGYGTYKVFDVEHKNDVVTFIEKTPSLGQKSSTSVTNFTISSIDEERIFQVATNPQSSINSPVYIRLFFGTDETVSNSNYISYSEGLSIQINPSEIKYSTLQLSASLQSGTTVYVKAYGESYFSNQYTDPELNKEIFPNLNANTVDAVSFVVP